MGDFVGETDLRRIIHIMRQHGESLSAYREGFLRRRIANRFRKTGIKSVSDYIHLLRTSPVEARALKRELSINVSEFFRDPPVWAATQEIIEEFLRKSGRISIWSAGTASGEEAYSLAISSVKALRKTGRAPNPLSLRRISVLGTDIDRNNLIEAKNGIYPKIRIRNISPPDRRYFFTEKEPGWYQVKEEIRRMVRFQADDLSRTEVSEEMDLILCRNVMIYLSRGMIEEIWKNIRDITAPGAYVILGRSEAIVPKEREYFEIIDPINRIYRRI